MMQYLLSRLHLIVLSMLFIAGIDCVSVSASSQTFGSTKANFEFSHMCSITSSQGKVYGCMVESGSFFLLVPDKIDCKVETVKVGVPFEYTVKKSLGPLKEDNKGEMFLVEGTFGLLVDIKGKEMTSIGSTDGENLYFGDLVLRGSKGTKVGDHFKTKKRVTRKN